MTSAWTVLLVGVLTGSATLVGGNVVLCYNRALPLLLGFSSGAVIGVALSTSCRTASTLRETSTATSASPLPQLRASYSISPRTEGREYSPARETVTIISRLRA